SSNERVESYFHTPTSMDFLIGSNDAQTHRLALYFCSYQNEQRLETLQVLDTATGAVLDSRQLTADQMQNGIYVVYNYSGNVTFRVINNLPSTPTAAVSGFFWGGAASPGPGPVPPPTSDTTPPSANIVAPFGNISGVVNVVATANDNVGVVSLQF